MRLKSFDNFLLLHEEESNAHKEAVKMGLQYQGFGYWTDPRTGEVTHQTVGGELKPYSGNPAEMGVAGQNPDALQSKPGMQDMPTGPKMAPGTGIAGAPEPGTEQHPRGANWNPGPNGDNCVNDQPPPKDLAYDTFVGKTNYYKWTAGPEGSNYVNVSVKDLLTEPPAKREHKEHSFFTFLTEKGNPTAAGLGGMTPAEKAASMGLQSDGHGSYRDSQGNIVARTVNGELQFYELGGGAVSDSDGGSQMAMAKPTWSDPTTGMATTPPSKPETPEEIAAVPTATPSQAPSGYERHMNKKKLDAYANQALMDDITKRKMEVQQKYEENPLSRAFNIGMSNKIDQMMDSQFEDERALGAHMMDIMVDGSDEIIKRLQDSDPNKVQDTVQEIGREIEREAQNRNNVVDEPNEDPKKGQSFDTMFSKKKEEEPTKEQKQIEEMRQKALQQYERHLKDSKLKKEKEVTPEQLEREKFKPFVKALDDIEDPDAKSAMVTAMLQAMSYGEYNNNKSQLMSGPEVRGAKKIAQHLRESYQEDENGRFDIAKAEEFVQSTRTYAGKIPDSVKRAAFDALPKRIQDRFSGGDIKKTNDGLFEGFSYYCDQGGMCGYTGVPLDLESFAVEHFVDNSRVQNGKATPEEAEFITTPSRGQFWSNKAPNSQKSERSPAAFADVIDTLSEYPDDYFDFQDNEIVSSKSSLKLEEVGLIGQGLMENGNLAKGIDANGIDSVMNLVGTMYDEHKKQLSSKLTKQYDPDGLARISDAKAQKLIENGEMTEDQDTTRKLVRELQSNIKKLSDQFGRRALKSMGLTVGFAQSLRSRTVDVGHDSIYTSFLKTHSRKPESERKAHKDAWSASILAASQAATEAKRDKTSKTRDADIRDASMSAFIDSALKYNLFDEEEIEGNKYVKKLLNRTVSEAKIDENVTDVDQMEPIIEIIKKLQKLTKKKQ